MKKLLLIIGLFCSYYSYSQSTSTCASGSVSFSYSPGVNHRMYLVADLSNINGNEQSINWIYGGSSHYDFSYHNYYNFPFDGDSVCLEVKVWKYDSTTQTADTCFLRSCQFVNYKRCDTSYDLVMTLVDSANHYTINSSGTSPNSTLQCRFFWVDGQSVNSCSNDTTYSVYFNDSNRQHVICVEEWRNLPSGDTCFFYTCDTITSTNVLSTNNLLAKEKLALFPNPSGDYVSVTFPKTTAQHTELVITDVLGKTVKRVLVENTYKTKINVQDFNPGTYIMSVVDKSSGELLFLPTKFLKVE